MTDPRRLSKRLLIAACLLAVAASPSACGGGGGGAGFPEIHDLDDFYAAYGRDNPLFVSYETEGVIAFFRQRMVGDAIVQGDHVLYQFDKSSGDLLKERIRWDAPVPLHIPPDLISQRTAEAVAGGDVESSTLYFIAPDSAVMPLDPAPRNPCWVLCSGGCDDSSCVIVDAVRGVVLGTAVPPPDYEAFSGTGPKDDHPCQQDWHKWQESAAVAFESMGYSTDVVRWPTENEVRSHVASYTTALFYEIGHSNETFGLLFRSGCDGNTYEETTAVEVADWIAGYTKMPFTFLASCYGMAGTGPETLSYAFRKGSSFNTAVVGYKYMSEDYCKLPCWISDHSLHWQNALFEYMSQGQPVKQAFEQATLDWPTCAPCTAFIGDESFAVVPVVARGFLKIMIDVCLVRFPEFLDFPWLSPVARRSLEDAEAETEAARLALEEGRPKVALERLEQAVIHLEQARVAGVSEAAELVEKLTDGVDRHVGEALVDAGFVVDSGNEDLRQATSAYSLARSLLDTGDEVAAMGLFVEAWTSLEEALGA